MSWEELENQLIAEDRQQTQFTNIASACRLSTADSTHEDGGEALSQHSRHSSECMLLLGAPSWVHRLVQHMPSDLRAGIVAMQRSHIKLLSSCTGCFAEASVLKARYEYPTVVATCGHA